MNEHRRYTVFVALTPTGLNLTGVWTSLCSLLFTTLFWYHSFLFGEKNGEFEKAEILLILSLLSLNKMSLEKLADKNFKL